jgi:diacylglycerol kinase
MASSAIFFGVTRQELVTLLIVTGFVWSAEIFNTAIEALLDHFHSQRHPRVKFIKDMSAAAVLVAAVTAFLTGLIIFIPKLF